MQAHALKLGLNANWKQFSLLVLVNAFVGGMIGLERNIFPEFAETRFGISSKTAILSFIVAFGIAKAIANYFTGRLANKVGRKNLLVLGWLIAMPIPWILITAPSWNWVIFANILLGISQGLTWSSTVVMKMDLVGEEHRGFAMGLNEFAGYLAVGVMAYWSAYIAHTFGVYPYPFYLGIILTMLGFLFSLFAINDTHKYAQLEDKTSRTQKLKQVFIETSFKNKTLSSVTQAGLVNNLNDGMIWGLLPMALSVLHFTSKELGIITAIYPAVWGIGQLFTGKMADRYNKKSMLFWGMLLQGLAIFFLAFSSNFYFIVFLVVLLGLGTALVYPTFLSTIAEATRPAQRAESMGTFRLWRDLGYALGALISGFVADVFGIEYAIMLIGMITIFSSLIIQWRMPKNENAKC